MPILTPRLPPRRVRTAPDLSARGDGASDAATPSNAEEENALRRSWRGVIAMVFNGPPHDWIENDAPPPRFLQDAWTNLHPWTPVDVAQRNVAALRASSHPEANCAIGRPVTQTIGGLCTGVPAFKMYIPVIGLPVPWIDKGGIAVRSFTRQEQSLHRWKPMTADRLERLIQRVKTQHPKHLPLTHMSIAIDELNHKHLRVSTVKTDDGATLNALEEVLPLRLPSPLLSPRAYTPTALEGEEETDDFGFTLGTSTARLQHSMRQEEHTVIPIGVLVPNSL